MQTSFGEVAYFSLGVWPPKPENENKKLQEWNSPKQALYVVQWKKTRKWKNETAPNRLCMLSNESLDNYYRLLHQVFCCLWKDILDKLGPPEVETILFFFSKSMGGDAMLMDAQRHIDIFMILAWCINFPMYIRIEFRSLVQ